MALDYDETIKPGLAVNLGGINLKNPVVTASGTFGYGREYAGYFDLNRLGGITVKGVSLNPLSGNPTPRTAETPAGMLNAIGLENNGLNGFISEALPFLRKFDTAVIVNIFGNCVEEYAQVAAGLDGLPGVDGIEVNISCPNVKAGGIAFGIDPEQTYQVISAVRQATRLPLIAKLSPNVTDIVLIARAAQDAGADALSLINTLRGMAIDIEKKRPRLANITGGLSGPAIRPVAVRMVWEVSQAVDIPLLGMGGIMTAEDALEFILAGAQAVAVGTASFVDPLAAVKVIEGIESYLIKNKIGDILELVGSLKTEDG
jgi:dihydroorotate dehydrogenase (NAD+) catalytic subunit